ncbi:DUF1707 SHOCT-like domain-containing protein [Pseudonocardia lacus]|uniref:DUF1707 SHOCT-like domain-containing protein n=1 Tax=Pseudonocardia lacus TaxID=2835865 RepID=UPI001BDDB2B6|nr:DUF1707 domain-containing protein [Pseudonocardia lacus]
MTVQPPDPARPPGIRISDADRERAAERLHQALAEGRITVQELEDRLSAVYAAKYEADLVPPLIDLPGGQIAARPTAVPVPAANAEPVVLRAGMSTIKRTGAWSVPPKLRVQTGMGSVVLDFVEADNPHPVVEVELELGAGSAKLIVPDEATANVDGVVATMGSVKSKLPSTPRAGAPHFIVTGRAAMGSVTVRKRFRWGG